MEKEVIFCGSSGVEERYFSLTAEPGKDFMSEARKTIAALKEWAAGKTVLRLCFHLSDPANQQEQLLPLADELNCSWSAIGQPPASGARIAAEAYALQGFLPVERGERRTLLALQNYRILWHSCRWSGVTGSGPQTAGAFEEVRSLLAEYGGTLAGNLQRTWLYCRDVDNNYRDLVVARRELFENCGLTARTHYIASTGIEGIPAQPGHLVLMTDVSLFGHRPEQIAYLSAPEHLSPTHVYGVTFERGTRIIYGDRSHYYISGTASIDRDGHTLFERDVARQAERLAENVEALMRSGGGTLNDLKQAVIYLRDLADREAVGAVLNHLLPESCARIMVKAPVCRPGWLVEMEAIAVNGQGDCRFKEFR